MCVKFISRNLNSDPCTPHPTNTYTCKITIVSKMCSGTVIPLLCDCIIG